MAFKRNGRRDGPTTLRTVGGHTLGAKPPPSARAMQREVDDRRYGQLIKELMPKLTNRQHNHVVQMTKTESGKDIYDWLVTEGVASPGMKKKKKE